MRAQAEIQFDGDYDDVCDASSQSGIMYRDAYDQTDKTGAAWCIDENERLLLNSSGIQTQGAAGGGLDPDGSAWATAILLSSGDWFCVDALGSAVTTTILGISYVPVDKTC